MRRLLQRVGLVIAVAAVAILCLSSAWLAAAIGVITAAIVAVDMIAFSRPPRAKPEEPDESGPDRISVDLSRRRR